MGAGAGSRGGCGTRGKGTAALLLRFSVFHISVPRLVCELRKFAEKQLVSAGADACVPICRHRDPWPVAPASRQDDMLSAGPVGGVGGTVTRQA